MKTGSIVHYVQAMMDLARYSGVGYYFTDERTLDRRGRGYVPSPDIQPFLDFEKRLTIKHKK